MRDIYKEKLIQKLRECPLIFRYLGPSLLQRIETDYWFENRFVRSMIRNTGWIEQHEQLLVEAEIDQVGGSDQIFSALNGNDPYYDLKLFDSLTEVRLIRWARQKGYTNIEKLTTGDKKVPDFLMKRGEESIIAEAKRFRERDYISEFIEDWLSGLVMISGLLSRFGISLRMTDKYDRTRQQLLDARRQHELEYREKIREELSKDWLEKTEACLESKPQQEFSVIDDLFIIWKSEIPMDTGFITSLAETSPKVIFEKLKGNLFSSLEQINSYITARNEKGTPDKAIIFVSGTGPWSYEWDTFWETLSTGSDPELLDMVKETEQIAGELINIPFDLVVGKDNPLRYVSFPWPN